MDEGRQVEDDETITRVLKIPAGLGADQLVEVFDEWQVRPRPPVPMCLGFHINTSLLIAEITNNTYQPGVLQVSTFSAQI